MATKRTNLELLEQRMDKSADSPIKEKQANATDFSRDVWFSHFSDRKTHQLSTEPLYATKFSRDGSMLATSF